MILIAAIAVGALAAFMIFNYVGGVEDQANQGAERVDVFVVRKDIPKGLPGEQARDEGYIVQDKIPREFLPASAVRSLDQIDGRVALNNLAANQVLVDGMFVDPAQAQIGFSARIPDSMTAITVSIDEVRGVAGLLVPGDKVDLFLTAQQVEDGAEGDTGVPNRAISRLAYHSVEILAIGQTATPQPGENITAAGAEGEDPAAQTATVPSSGLITFLVPLEAAQMISAMDAGEMYLTLVGPDYDPEPLPPLELDPADALPGESGSELTPYGPDGAPE